MWKNEKHAGADSGLLSMDLIPFQSAKLLNGGREKRRN